MSTATPKPDFVIAGFAKTASTTLASRLASHPEICFSAPKEPNIYIREGIPGNTQVPAEEAYAHHTDAHRLTGEGSVRYSSTHLYPEAAGNLATASPEAKLIFIVRDPVARAISHWRMLRTEEPALLPPEELLDYQWAADALLTCGDYRTHIQHFRQFFGREQMAIIDFEDVVHRPQATLVDLFRFLDPTLEPTTVDTEVSANKTESNRALPTPLLTTLRRTPAWTTMTRLFPSSLRSTIRHRLQKPPPKPEVSDAFVDAVRDRCDESYRWALERRLPTSPIPGAR